MSNTTEYETHALDHLAIHVADRDAVATELVERFDMHVIEHTERFTLVGADFGHGKLTLLDPEGDEAPQPRRIVSIMLAERAGIPLSAPVHLSNGLVITFAAADQLGIDWERVPRHALVGVTLRCDDPTVVAAGLARQHGMRVASARRDVAILDVGDRAGDGRITLMRERLEELDAPSMLDHIGVRVDDAEQWRAHAHELDADIVKWVDAPHSKAVFVAGPEALLLEFVEHTAPLDGA